MIASGGYERGRRLPAERTLSERLGVSRGTVRKAISQLAELGVITIRPNSGIYVEDTTRDRLPRDVLPPSFIDVALSDVIEARKAIELPAAERACTTATEEQKRTITDLVDRMAAAADDLGEFLKLDMQFHQALVRASGNMVLAAAFESIYEYHRFSSVFTSRQDGDEEVALGHHRRILAALEAGDGERCRAILGEHLDHMSQYTENPHGLGGGAPE